MSNINDIKIGDINWSGSKIKFIKYNNKKIKANKEKFSICSFCNSSLYYAINNQTNSIFSACENHSVCKQTITLFEYIKAPKEFPNLEKLFDWDKESFNSKDTDVHFITLKNFILELNYMISYFYNGRPKRFIFEIRAALEALISYQFELFDKLIQDREGSLVYRHKDELKTLIHSFKTVSLDRNVMDDSIKKLLNFYENIAIGSEEANEITKDELKKEFNRIKKTHKTIALLRRIGNITSHITTKSRIQFSNAKGDADGESYDYYKLVNALTKKHAKEILDSFYKIINLNIFYTNKLIYKKEDKINLVNERKNNIELNREVYYELIDDFEIKKEIRKFLIYKKVDLIFGLK